MPQKIMIIRHAEKPDASTLGVLELGNHDPESLTPRGWQRAGALAVFFGAAGAALPAPDIVFATAVAQHSKSARPQQTVTPLIEKLKAAKRPVTAMFDHQRGSEDRLVADAVKRDGVVLICWQHEEIPAIAHLILGDETSCPQKWPGDRFDLVWLFDPKPGGGWRLSQLPQLLLAGDGAALAA